MNLYEETIQKLKEYDLILNDVTIIFQGEILKNNQQIREKLNQDYNYGWGRTYFPNIQIIIDEHT